MPTLNDILLSAPLTEAALDALLAAIAQHSRALTHADRCELWLWSVGTDGVRRLQLAVHLGTQGSPSSEFECACRVSELFPGGVSQPLVRSTADGEHVLHCMLGAFGYLVLTRHEHSLHPAGIEAVRVHAEPAGHAIAQRLNSARLARHVEWIARCTAHERTIAARLSNVCVLKDLCVAIDALARDLLAAQCARVSFLDGETAQLERSHARESLDSIVREDSFEADASHAAEVIRTGQVSVLRADSSDDPLTRLFTPVRFDGVVVGVLALTLTAQSKGVLPCDPLIVSLSDLAGQTYARIAAQHDRDHRRSLFDALHTASERLLALIDWRPSATAALAILGTALDAEAMAILELPRAHEAAGAASPLEFVWQPIFGLPWLHARRVEEFARLERDRLALHHSVFMEFEGSTQRTLLKPIFADGALWGVLVFEPHGTASRAPSRATFEVLRSLAETVGAVIAREAADEALRQRQKAEAVGMLAAGIAHDFNNLLWPITLYGEMLVTNPELDGRSKRMLLDMQQSARAMGEVVQQVLAISRRRDRVLELVPVAEIAIGVTEILRRTVSRSISITSAIDADVGTVIGDAGSFHQVLMTLATRAVAAIEHAQQASAGARRLEMQDAAGTLYVEVGTEYRSERRFITVVVQDDGVTLDPQARQHLFDAYVSSAVRGSEEETRSVGDALGLSLVHRIVTEMEGTITVQSAAGRGTRFEIRLPTVSSQAYDEARLSSIPAPAVAVATSLHDAKLGECVLFVDDDRAVLEVGQQMLESIGYEVIACARARDAVEILSDPARIVTLLLTDLTMPVMTGIELARESKHLRPRLRIICCTGFSDSQTETSAIDAGMSAVLRKPIHLDVLASTLRRVIDKG